MILGVQILNHLAEGIVFFAYSILVPSTQLDEPYILSLRFNDMVTASFPPIGGRYSFQFCVFPANDLLILSLSFR